ncbi:anti-sigma factor antagonist [Streptosporangium sp. NPDC006930]|uniref:STAS domain-containing protein n=1 Tax=unclassified Streptosporangium TaxID=2632669 RepID=UPI00342538B8
MTTRLDLSVRRHEGASVIVLAGELDKLSSPRLRDVLVTQLDDGVGHLILDVTALRFCDSTGLWTMLELQRRASAAGGCLRLVGVHGVLERILTVTGLASAFSLDPDVPASLRAVTPAASDAEALPSVPPAAPDVEVPPPMTPAASDAEVPRSVDSSAPGTEPPPSAAPSAPDAEPSSGPC